MGRAAQHANSGPLAWGPLGFLDGGLPCFVDTTEGKLVAGIPGKEHRSVSCVSIGSKGWEEFSAPYKCILELRFTLLKEQIKNLSS